ncbi:MAG: ROK family protein [Oleispira sp.]
MPDNHTNNINDTLSKVALSTGDLVETPRPIQLKVGIDLGGTKIEIIVLSPQGDTVLRQRISTPAKQNFNSKHDQYQAIIIAIKNLISASADQLQMKRLNQTFKHIGIGIPGAISPTTGLVKNANTTCLIGQAFQQDLEQALNCPVKIANDADCFVLSEARDGAAKGANSVFGIIIGTGCGGGLVINQQLVAGPNAICGEWGHNPLPWPQVDEVLMPCYCGKHGCIETFLSGPGFTLHANKNSDSIRSSEQWHQALLENEPQAIKVFDTYARQLAKSLASVINIIDPEVIVLGGGMSNIDYLYQRVPEILAEYVFSEQVLTRLVKAEHGDSSGVRGAAFL